MCRPSALSLGGQAAGRSLESAAGFRRRFQSRHRVARKSGPSGRLPASAPLTAFSPLAQLPGIRLFSLQKGPGSDQLQQVVHRWPLTDLAGQLEERAGAFMDTAAVMKNLDLVVTVDTAIAHLAGALAVPVYVALASVADWRWLVDREDSPWYPTMRLFRQHARGDWSNVFERIAAAIACQNRCNPGQLLRNLEPNSNS